MRSRQPARRRNLRLAQALAAQAPRSLRFKSRGATIPHRALVTGGNKGIGAAVAHDLAALGSAVLVAARHVDDDLDAGVPAAGAIGGLSLDLGDLDAVTTATSRLADALDGGHLDLVVLNAGVAPARMMRSAQGHELAFAVNVLGHHVLLEQLRVAGALASGARIVVVTGDILMIARDCTPDFESDHPRAGTMAYARSKLGLLWLATDLARRHRSLHVVAVHPGVVRSGLGGGGRRWQQVMHISPARSSRTVLTAACDKAIPSGAYLHNTLGLVRLRDDDPAADTTRAAAFVSLLDALAAPWLPATGAT